MYKQWLDIIVVSFCGVVKIVVKHMLVKNLDIYLFQLDPQDGNNVSWKHILYQSLMIVIEFHGTGRFPGDAIILM